MANQELKNNYEYLLPIRVRFRDVDAMDMVNHGEILSYFETVRTEYMMDLMGYETLNDLDFILANVNVDYHSPVAYTDDLIAGVRVANVGNSSFTMEYRLEEEETGRLIADGKTVQVFFDYEIMESKPAPDRFKQKMGNR